MLGTVYLVRCHEEVSIARGCYPLLDCEVPDNYWLMRYLIPGFESSVFLILISVSQGQTGTGRKQPILVRGYAFEWADVIADLDALQQVHVQY